MRRVIVLGGLGLFGRSAAQQLRQLGVPARIASRSAAADVQIDANDRASLRASLRADDVVIDAAGPFHTRSTALIEAAIEIGFDLIDFNDDLRYAESVLAIEPRIANAGIRVLSSASSVSAVSASIVRHSGTAAPRRVTTFLAPASRHTANTGTALSLIRSVGKPVRVFRDGQLQSRIGWTEPRRFPMPRPVGSICGRLFESADAVYLPRIWPSLQDVSMHVDSNTPGVNLLLRVAAHAPAVGKFLETSMRLGTRIARTLGSTAGGIAYEIEDAGGHIARYAIISGTNSFMTAVAPAVLAARAIANDQFAACGLIRPDRHVEPGELFEFLGASGINVTEVR